MKLGTLVAKYRHFSYRLKSRKRKFTEIYSKYGFGGVEYPKSGIGSSLEQTERIRKELPQLLSELRITSIIDAPCGDFTWMQTIDLKGITYRGYDIVKNVTEDNRKKYSTNTITFEEADIVTQVLSRVDLILSRDCFVHLSNQDVFKALSKFKQSGSTYLLTTTFVGQTENRDLVSGRGWRPLNLEIPPFNFPKPLKLINEECTEMDGKCSDKCLGLWELDTLIHKQ